MIDIKLIKKEYPNSYKKLEEFTKDQLVNYGKILLQQGDGYTSADLPELTDDLIYGSILFNFRQLYEFFDKQYIIVLLDGPDEMHGWSWQIRTSKETYNDPSSLSMTRIECEVDAFKKAFEVLENQ